MQRQHVTGSESRAPGSGQAASAEQPALDEQAAPAGEDALPGAVMAGGRRAAAAKRRRRARMAAGVVAALVAGVAAAWAAGAFRGSPAPAASAGSAGSAGHTGTATVTRRTLTSQTLQNGTLGDAGAWTVAVPASESGSSGAPAAGTGTFTWLPQSGQVIRQGQRIYAVSGNPVVLLYGPLPAYRDLSEGMTGADVTELNRDLVRLGYASAAALGPRSGWDDYSAETASAVDQLQARLGLIETGTLTLGQAVFLPGPALVTALGTSTVLGGPAAPGSVVLTATSTTPVVTIQLDPSLQAEIRDGDHVTITLPDGRSTAGTVRKVGRVASAPGASSSGAGAGSAGQPGDESGSSGATIAVLVTLTHPRAAGKLNQAAVTVTITTGSASAALAVRVDALLAQPGGKYAVQVTGPGGQRLIPVTIGMFDDAAGLVQVSGNLTPGQHVVVPGI
jgi:hypothetical protein